MHPTIRKIEGKLIIFASIILLFGFLLVFLSKLPDMYKIECINLNTTSAESIAKTIDIDLSIAKLITSYREQHHPYLNTSAIRYIPLLSDSEINSLSGKSLHKMSASEIGSIANITDAKASRLKEVLGDRDKPVTEAELRKATAISSSTMNAAEPHIRIREPRTVFIQFWIYYIAMILGFIILHAFLRRSAPRIDPFILPCIMLLCGLGAIALFSIKDPIRDTFIYAKQVQGILLGMFIMCIPFMKWYRNLRFWRYTYIYALLAILITILLTLFGSGPGGAKLQMFGMQPIEIVKILLAFFVASYLTDRWIVLTDRSNISDNRFKIPMFHDIAPLLVMYILSLATFILVKDLGPMMILFGMFIIMLYISTGKIGFAVIGLLAITITGAIAYYLHLGVFDVRVDMWLNPWKNNHSNGMQLGEALWGLGTGGIWGSGLGLGQPNLMPRSGSDLIFASLGEELGLIGSLCVIALLAIIITRGFKTAVRSGNNFQQLITVSLVTLFSLQVIVILFGVLGLIPLTGVTLPFISYGRSSLAASFFIGGIVLYASSMNTHAGPDVKTMTNRNIKRLSTFTLIMILGVAGIARLMIVQGVSADKIAGRLITTPDADGYIRPHINPRLKYIEESIMRGSVYDRNGQSLITSGESEMTDLRDRKPNRYYALGETASHITGYLDPRCGGPTGVEKRYNNQLRGFDDYSELLPLYRYSHTPFKPDIIGKDIYLTIDSKLQSAVRKSLIRHTENIRDKITGKSKTNAAAIVIDIHTGEILANVSLPDFDPNSLTKAEWIKYNKNDNAPLLNRALYGYYPPGSVFKLITASAALKNNKDFIYRCNHKATNISWKANRNTYSRRQITDLEEMQAHGITDLAKAIRVSCNVYFAMLGIELGAEKLHDIIKSFDFSRIPQTSKLAEDLPDNAYGQGTILATPMEIVKATAAIANGGIMMQPHFLKSISMDGNGIEQVLPIEIGRPISSDDASKLRKMMTDAASKGTGRGLFNGLNVAVGGKTGSAENDRSDKMPHSWFTGFAPAENPSIAFAVVIENGGYGRNAAGPVCRDIIKTIFK